MTGADIINEVLQYLNMKASVFAKTLGYERPQKIYDVQKGKTRSISYELADDIVKKYPEINKSWLLTGEGPMIKEKQYGQNMSFGDNGVGFHVGGANLGSISINPVEHNSAKSNKEIEEIISQHNKLLEENKQLILEKNQLILDNQVLKTENEYLKQTIEKNESLIDRLLSRT